MSDFIPLLVVLLAFGAVAGVVFVIGQHLSQRAILQRRATAHGPLTGGTQRSTSLQAFITRNFDEHRFGVDSTMRGKLRLQLLQAGFFRNDAINYYIFSRLAVVATVPVLAYLGTQFFPADAPWFAKMVVLAVSFLVAVIGPDAYLARRRDTLTARYRQLFPDLVDLLTVCIDAGLSFEGALDRITQEIGRQNRELGLNLLVLTTETRAGRSTMEAVESFAERIGLDEARSFVLVLRQSLELGSDVSEALHVFSDEMREKRLLRAEEAAAKLPAKLVLPLGVFIFPVIMVVVLLPIMLRLMTVVFK